jgi:hypothetical protein
MERWQTTGRTLNSPGYTFSKLLEDAAGTVWVSALGTVSGKFCSIQKADIECSTESGRLGHGVFSMYAESHEPAVGHSRERDMAMETDPLFFSLPGTLDSLRDIVEEDANTILIGTGTGVQRLTDGKIVPYTLPRKLQTGAVRALLRDRAGSFWIGNCE